MKVGPFNYQMLLVGLVGNLLYFHIGAFYDKSYPKFYRWQTILLEIQYIKTFASYAT